MVPAQQAQHSRLSTAGSAQQALHSRLSPAGSAQQALHSMPEHAFSVVWIGGG